MTKYIYGIFVAVVLGTMGCKDQLDIGNPNAPTLSANVNTETGVISLAQGGVYINGFLNGDTWLGNSYFSLPMGYNELMADNVGASASNNQVTTVGQPDYIILDDGTKMTNTSPSVGILRTYNTRAATGAGNNAIHYQWLNMYALNNACNLVLSVVDEIPFTGDAASKANTIKAWCYWWKGFAYASIGTKYYAGLIVNEYGVSSNDYVLHDVILNESNTYFNLAATTLSGITSTSDYAEVLVQLIPSHTQVGNGGVPTIDMWKRNINTMLARNILLNKLSPFVNNNPDATITQSSMSGVMTDADWNAVKTLATDGIQKGDIIFTGRTTGTNDFFSATGGTVASLTATNVSTATFKVSERVIQNFKTGDKRFDNNFNTSNRYSNDYIYTTRYNTVNGGNGIEGVFVYADRDAGEHELIIAGSYEENALMLAEANIRLDDIDAGLSYIDDVRDYFGAGLTAVSGTGLTVSEALSELTKERRVALLFRGLSYYDSRRWGWTYDISKGGGSYGNTIVQGTVVNTNAIINYNFMDYWDVPANESALNPPSESSVAVKNPNY
ncbi:RagB/SusD family nutrient uptake outer membrane protein [Ohtaekwangia koreensis]|uniref:SusD family protein n=1 Tax=Ohtaekwangia koreensis TaxID=688867 RepID=A0A1T5MKL2_9BACT|nr:RagB/SusD family nutrient uptake outer membrane protein [Ohtaekwangia koreensis]SKC88746.1 SusD family protein [Ohtaekwangia koreensis]